MPSSVLTAQDAGITSSPAPVVSRETITTAIINQKGGVGKTTTAVSMAHGLALQGKSVLLLDLDPQGNATLSLGVTPGDAPEHSATRLLSGERVAPLPTRYENLHLLAGSPDLIMAELSLLDIGTDRQSALRRGLADAALPYDHIVIDAPPSLGLLALNILAASDHIVVPVQTEFLALEGVNNLRRTVELLSAQLRKPPTILGFLMTMVDSRTNLSQTVAAGLRATLGDLVFNASIPRTVRLSECPSLRRTIFDYDRWGVGARAYEAFVYEYLGRLHGARVGRTA